MASPRTAAAEDRLTVAEVAVVADASPKVVYRVIHDHVLPRNLFVTKGHRKRLSISVAGIVAFHCTIHEKLNPAIRKDVFNSFVRVYHNELTHWSWKETLCKNTLLIVCGPLTIDAAPDFLRVAKRLEKLEAARSRVVKDPGILGGEPIVAGTRVPVYWLANSAESGMTIERILEAYPSLSRDDVELGILWAKANPPQGRPKTIRPNPGSTVAATHYPRRPRNAEATR